MSILRAACAAVSAFGLAAGALAQAPYPAKPVRLVVPYPPGASNDVLSRITAQAMAPGLGQPIVVDNRAGAGGMIGAEHVARSEADGYTILNVQSSFTTNAAIRAKLPYEPLMGQLKAGRLKALGVGGAKRSALAPELPTISESGVPGYVAELWWGLAAPAKTPPEILNRLSAELTKALQSSDVKERYAREGGEPVIMARAEFTEFVRKEIERWRKVAREANIQPE